MRTERTAVLITPLRLRPQTRSTYKTVARFCTTRTGSNLNQTRLPFNGCLINTSLIRVPRSLDCEQELNTRALAYRFKSRALMIGI
jgi:hypothetical protein